MSLILTMTINMWSCPVITTRWAMMSVALSIALIATTHYAACSLTGITMLGYGIGRSYIMTAVYVVDGSTTWMILNHVHMHMRHVISFDPHVSHVCAGWVHVLALCMVCKYVPLMGGPTPTQLRVSCIGLFLYQGRHVHVSSYPDTI